MDGRRCSCGKTGCWALYVGQAELVRLDETLGLDALRELWAEPEEDGLPAALWSLYLLRAWLTRQSAEAARIYRSGRGHAPVADAVSGVPDSPVAEDLASVGDAVVTTALRGDPPAAMERAAAVHRVSGVLAFVGENDEPLARELRELHAAVSPVIVDRASA